MVSVPRITKRKIAELLRDRPLGTLIAEYLVLDLISGGLAADDYVQLIEESYVPPT